MAAQKMATVLSGGGARGAYQAGVMRALFEVSKDADNMGLFRNLCGVSAGAINACSLASRADHLDEATSQLCQTWKNLNADQVFRTDYTSMTRNALKVMRSVGLSSIGPQNVSRSIGLLNTQPLKYLIENNIEFHQIQKQLDAGRMDSISCTATDYSTSLSVTFVQAADSYTDWASDNRISQASSLSPEHVMASSAIPIFFPPVEIRGRYFGDGSLRNSAPLSPAIHLGAEKILVVGVRNWGQVTLETAEKLNPSLGRVISVLINAIFLDSVESDLEKLKLLNKHISEVPDRKTTTDLKPLSTFYIHPTKDLASIAAKQRGELPRIIRYLFDGLGSPEESAELLSYFLFEPNYCSSLVELGYNDTLSQKNQLIEFLSS